MIWMSMRRIINQSGSKYIGIFIDCCPAHLKTNSCRRRRIMKSRVFAIAAAVMLLSNGTVFGQGGQRGQRGRPPARPAPRQPDGRMSLGPIPGELGVWLPGAGGAERLVDPEPGDPLDAQFPIPAAAKFP